MRIILLSCLFSMQWLFGQAIVFVHIGEAIPSHAIDAVNQTRLFNPNIPLAHFGKPIPPYVIDAVKQARLFNPNIPIYLIASSAAFRSAPDIPAICVDAESLLREKNHDLFIRSCWNRGFWRLTTERFFYLFEFMKKYQLSDVIHLENDNLLYANLEELLPIFKKYYSNQLGVTFDNDERGVAGIMYISNPEPLEEFLNSILKHPQQMDMEQLALFKSAARGVHIDHLPITAPCYAEEHPLLSPFGFKGSHPGNYHNHYEEFHAIFDAAAIGQYLGGLDPMHGPIRPGFINESCVINPSFFDYEWIEDSEGRKAPYAVYNGEKIKIVNLHIHCKDLKRFSSKEL
jgi:hypothetical protein